MNMNNRITLVLLAIGMVMSELSCRGETSKIESTPKGLTPEGAREAIVTMLRDPKLRASQIPSEADGLFTHLRSDKYIQELNAATVKRTAGDQISFGDWQCNLKRESFSAMFFGGGHYHDIEGVFERDEHGRWTARVASVKVGKDFREDK